LEALRSALLPDEFPGAGLDLVVVVGAFINRHPLRLTGVEALIFPDLPPPAPF